MTRLGIDKDFLREFAKLEHPVQGRVTEVKLAGSLSLAVSLPTMSVASARYSHDQSFVVLRQNGRFVLAMTVGSVAGTLMGALLFGVMSALVLIPGLALVLVLSAVKL